MMGRDEYPHYTYSKQIIIDLSEKNTNPLPKRLYQKWEKSHSGHSPCMLTSFDETDRALTYLQPKKESLDAASSEKKPEYATNEERTRIYIVAHGAPSRSDIAKIPCATVAQKLKPIIAAESNQGRRVDINLIICNASTGLNDDIHLTEYSTAAQLHREIHRETGREDVDVIARNTYVGTVDPLQNINFLFYTEEPKEEDILKLKEREIILYKKGDHFEYITNFPTGTTNKVSINPKNKKYKFLIDFFNTKDQNPVNQDGIHFLLFNAQTFNNKEVHQALLKTISQDHYGFLHKLTAKHEEKELYEEKHSSHMLSASFQDKTLIHRQHGSKIQFMYRNGKQVMIDAYFFNWKRRVLNLLANNKNKIPDGEREQLRKCVSAEMTPDQIAAQLEKYLTDTKSRNGLLIRTLEEWKSMQTLETIKEPEAIIKSTNDFIRSGQKKFNQQHYKEFLKAIPHIIKKLEASEEKISDDSQAIIEEWISGHPQFVKNVSYNEWSKFSEQVSQLADLYFKTIDAKKNSGSIYINFVAHTLAKLFQENQHKCAIQLYNEMLEKVGPNIRSDIKKMIFLTYASLIDLESGDIKNSNTIMRPQKNENFESEVKMWLDLSAQKVSTTLKTGWISNFTNNIVALYVQSFDQTPVPELQNLVANSMSRLFAERQYDTAITLFNDTTKSFGKEIKQKILLTFLTQLEKNLDFSGNKEYVLDFLQNLPDSTRNIQKEFYSEIQNHTDTINEFQHYLAQHNAMNKIP